MKKTNKGSENKIILKDIIDWVVVILAALISTNFFDNFKDNELAKYFLISLTTSLFTAFIWTKFFSDRKLTSRLFKEIEAKKILERQKEASERSLEWSKTSLSHAEKDKEELKKENKKLKNEKNQLRLVLSSYGTLQEELGIDGNISVFEWEANPERKKKIEEITQKTYREWLESERDVSSLSYQLEKHGISTDNQRVSDKRQRKWAIDYIEVYWRYKANENEKIKGKTIEQFLPINWKENFQKKEGKDIIEEKYRLIKLIDDFANSTK